jgi:cob(I)alamin adenosyltransferase
MEQRGCVQVYTGEGKGKTTAAIGLAVRAAGAGLRVCLLQFLKNARCGEHVALERFHELITVRQFGTGRFINGAPLADDRAEAKRGFDSAAHELREGTADIVILDEVCGAIALGLVDENELLRSLTERRAGVEVVLTGRGASERLVQAADLVSEMRAVKHYYDAGVAARGGIEC